MKKQPSLFDIIYLKKNLPKNNLFEGDIGTIVHIYTKPSLAYEIEFCNQNGETIQLITLEESDFKIATKK